MYAYGVLYHRQIWRYYRHAWYARVRYRLGANCHQIDILCSISWAKSRNTWNFLSKESKCLHGEQRNGRTSTASELGNTDTSQKRACLRSSTALYLQLSTMDSSNSDRELVAMIGHTDAPEAGSRRVPGFSAINAAGDADGRWTTVAPSVTVACSAAARALRFFSGYAAARAQNALARVAASRTPDAKFIEDTVPVARQSNERSSSSCSHGLMSVPCAVWPGHVSCIVFRVFGCLCLWPLVLPAAAVAGPS